MAKPKQPKTSKQKKPEAVAPPAVTGRLGAERWIAVRQKSGAGPMEPKARKGTRAERERRDLEAESFGQKSS